MRMLLHRLVFNGLRQAVREELSGISAVCPAFAGQTAARLKSPTDCHFVRAKRLAERNNIAGSIC